MGFVNVNAEPFNSIKREPRLTSHLKGHFILYQLVKITPNEINKILFFYDFT